MTSTSVKTDNNKLVTSSATAVSRQVTQEDITKLMDASIKWMADPLNPNRDVEFRTKTKAAVDSIGGICDGGVDPGTCPLIPDEGIPQSGGNQDAKTWKIVNMKKNKKWFKVVDNKGKNIAVEFKIKANAQQYIDHYVCIQTKPTPTPTPEPLTTKAIISPPIPTSVKPNQLVVLDGSKSTSATTPPNLTYVWNATGPAIIFQTISDPTFQFTTTVEEGDLKVNLKVIDTNAGTSDAQVTIKVSSVTPTPEPTGDKDEEGIIKIYKDDPTKANQKFIMAKDGLNSSRVLGKGARTQQSDGSWKITPDSGTNPASARIYIQTTNPSGYDIATQLKLGKDWKNMLTLPDPDGVKRGGYLVDNFDWRDAELSYYWKIPKLNTDDEMTCYLGGRHPSSDTWPDNCVSSCYKLQIQTQDLTSRSAIEWDHIGGSDNYAWNDSLKDAFSLSNELGGKIDGKLIGMKFIRYNNVENGVLKSVTMEMYLDLESKDLAKPDLSKQNWRFFTSVTHDGTNWPSQPKSNDRIKECNADGVTMPAWGAPTMAIRFDESDWIIYNLSVRPIITQKIGS